MKLLKLALPLLLVALAPSTFAQSVDYFLKIDGIPGESTNDRHVDEIEVAALAFGVLQPQLQKFAGGGASAAKTEISPISITKFVDKASPLLFINCATGKKIPTAVITAEKAGESPFEFLKITLTDVLISSVQQGAAEGGIVESVNISFSRITMSYVPQNPNGSQGTPVTVTFDLKSNKPITPQ